MVTDVDLYNKSTNGLSLPITIRMRGTTSEIVDAKLQDFFEYAQQHSLIKVKCYTFAVNVTNNR